MIRSTWARFRLRYAHLSIRTKLLMSFVLVIVAASVLMSIWYYARTTRYVQSDRETNFVELMNQTKISADNIISALEDASKSIVLNEKLEDILLFSDISHYSLSDQLDDYAYLSKYINTANVNDSIRQVRLYFVINSIYTHERTNLFHVSDAKGKSWYERALFVSGAPVWSHDDQGSISCVRAIMRYELPESECGFIEMVLDQELLKQALLNVVTTTHGNICLVDDFGRTLFPLGDAAEEFARIVNGNLDAIPFNASPRPMVGRDDELVIRRKLTNDWSIVASFPYANIRAEIRSIAMEILYICAAAILVASLFVTILTHSLVRRIRRVAEFMSTVDIRSDEYIAETQGDELTIVETNVNNMLRVARKSMHKEQEAIKRQKEADFDVLQEQINPHFLYNCLDSINWLAIEHHAGEISTMTTLLSRFFRLGLSRGNQIVSLEDELTHVRLYVQIVQMRFDGELSVYYDVQPGIARLNTLKFVLQPLVENAIEHGIANRPDQQGSVWIRCHLDGDVLVMSVEDDGAGMSESRLAALRSALRCGSRDVGFGLHNVSQRIMLHFGEAYGLEIDSAIGTGTKVVLRLPSGAKSDDE